MAVLGLVLRPEREDVVHTARRIIAWLAHNGHRGVLLEEDAHRVGGDAATVTASELGEADGVVSLGGDGTILQTVALLDGARVPVLGVNLGQLGYLAAIEPSVVEHALERFLAGEHDIEERMLLDVVVQRADPNADDESFRALNEAVLEKTVSGHTVRIGVSIDDTPFTPYEADGVIVATPTGSTAYAFSARGPILSPTHRALLLTPVSPHMLFDRSLVLGPESTIGLEVEGQRLATLTVDGRYVATLEGGDQVHCTGSAAVARLVRFETGRFTHVLKSKFGLADR